jgi:cyclopropane-fatty-acyl-phospholipid synthase
MPKDRSAEVASLDLGCRRRPGLRGLRDRIVLRALGAALKQCTAGTLHVTLPTRATGVFGRRDGHGEAHLVLRRYALGWKLMRRGALGFAESWMDGDFETDDLTGLLDFFLANHDALGQSLPALWAARRSDRRVHRDRPNTPTGSRRNIAAHYDLGNAFFRLWLDPTMSYSSGIYRRSDVPLEEAQREKHAAILVALGRVAGRSVLEIGCGWGGLAEALAEAGARVTAITISGEQHAEATARLSAAGVADRAEVRLQDYRDTGGTYDAIVSVEMIEAVGEENWPAYFGALWQRLRPGGVVVIQAITIAEQHYAHYRANPDFIQRYIFPGGMLPTARLMQGHAEAAGFAFETVERFGASYAQTLAEWRRRFDLAWPRIAAEGFDERFRRMWTYYLAYCEVGFARGSIDVGLYRLQKSH